MLRGRTRSIEHRSQDVQTPTPSLCGPRLKRSIFGPSVQLMAVLLVVGACERRPSVLPQRPPAHASETSEAELRAVPLPRSSTTLLAAQARIDALTATAEAAVKLIERAPPQQLDLVRLDAAFAQARQKLVTDTQLSRLGAQLSKKERKQVTDYSRLRYERLKRRVAAAGARHRRAKPNQPPPDASP